MPGIRGHLAIWPVVGQPECEGKGTKLCTGKLCWYMKGWYLSGGSGEVDYNIQTNAEYFHGFKEGKKCYFPKCSDFHMET